MANSGSFEMAFGRFNKISADQIEFIIRGSTFELFKNIVYDTPFDTGRARGNWQVSIDTPINSSSMDIDKEGNATIQKGQTQIMKPLGKYIYIQNNLAYIKPLEFGLYPNPVKNGSRRKNISKDDPIKYEVKSINGYSAKAPNGMVRINIVRMNTIIRKFKNKFAEKRIK